MYAQRNTLLLADVFEKFWNMCLEIYTHINWYAKVNNKFMKNYDKNKESSYLKYWGVNNLYGWTMSQKLPINGLKWVDETFKFKNMKIL